MKKVISLVITILFFILFIIPSSAKLTDEILMNQSSGNILFVGGSGPNNYTRIQDAIDNSNNGDTVFVYSGIYSDFSPGNWACVRIKKNIKLIGENKSTTIINGTGSQRVIIVDHQTNGVEICGFTIQHGIDLEPGDWALGVDVYSHTEVYDNIITNTNIGVYINQQHTDIQIHDNIIRDNKNGIEAEFNEQSSIDIYNNTIAFNECGFYSVSNSDLSFYNNNVSNNKIGIYFKYADSKNLISNNNIENNEIGLDIQFCKSTEIRENNFIKNQKHIRLTKQSLILTIPYLIFYRQKWSKNYWDDWNTTLPKPLSGLMIFYIRFFIPIKPFYILIPIGLLPYFEFDFRPASEPYTN